MPKAHNRFRFIQKIWTQIAFLVRSMKRTTFAFSTQSMVIGRPISVIIVVGVSALDFIERNRERIWPSTPVVFVAIDEATITRRLLPQNVTGATMQLTLQDMVKVARTVVPDLDSVAIVGDPLERQTFYRHFQEEVPSVANQLKIIDLMNLPVPELKKQLSSLSERTAVLY